VLKIREVQANPARQWVLHLCGCHSTHRRLGGLGAGGMRTKAGPSWGFPACCVGEKAFGAVINSPGAVGQCGRNSLCLLTGLAAPADQKMFNTGLPRLAY